VTDSGFYSQYNNNKYRGLIHDSSEDTWKLFKDMLNEPGGTAFFGGTEDGNLRVGSLTASGTLSIPDYPNVQSNILTAETKIQYLTGGASLTTIGSDTKINGTLDIPDHTNVGLKLTTHDENIVKTLNRTQNMNPVTDTLTYFEQKLGVGTYFDVELHLNTESVKVTALEDLTQDITRSDGGVATIPYDFNWVNTSLPTNTSVLDAGQTVKMLAMSTPSWRWVQGDNSFNNTDSVSFDIKNINPNSGTNDERPTIGISNGSVINNAITQSNFITILSIGNIVYLNQSVQQSLVTFGQNDVIRVEVVSSEVKFYKQTGGTGSFVYLPTTTPLTLAASADWRPIVGDSSSGSSGNINITPNVWLTKTAVSGNIGGLQLPPGLTVDSDISINGQVTTTDGVLTLNNTHSIDLKNAGLIANYNTTLYRGLIFSRLDSEWKFVENLTDVTGQDLSGSTPTHVSMANLTANSLVVNHAEGGVLQDTDVSSYGKLSYTNFDPPETTYFRTSFGGSGFSLPFDPLTYSQVHSGLRTSFNSTGGTLLAFITSVPGLFEISIHIHGEITISNAFHLGINLNGVQTDENSVFFPEGMKNQSIQTTIHSIETLTGTGSIKLGISPVTIGSPITLKIWDIKIIVKRIHVNDVA
jgi:hypothetical protein